ncbi:hypothetical protein ADN00_19045 [Ornatilinea apprima]|uniref:Prephenate dehydratase n=1 Tax=Ornatilinea apprima TaxID=1134406 RepID=A0A0P6X5E6_9CHLR|nr:prephenate dehydratase [Ornatilinea apprima]KPL70132.1 hypothetical protein ADN00_19045 [Ornatilinea apprima]
MKTDLPIIAFQGEHGAFSEAAAFASFGDQITTLPCESFEEVFLAVTSGRADQGLIPIENSQAGSIHQNYDLLLKYNLFITGEHDHKIEHCLIAFPDTERSALTQVISHPQALAQCAGYLSRLPGVKVTAVYDTAGSVKMLKESGDRRMAAIASQRAAELYEMRILDHGIQDSQHNYTRFLRIHPQPVSPQENAKTSLVFSLNHQPGSLYTALSVFARRGINLLKIESRPWVGKMWEYLFYIDFEGAASQPQIAAALAELQEMAPLFRLLGSYPRSKTQLTGASE